LGRPTPRSVRQDVEGELSEDDWHELLQELRKTYGRTGKVSEAAGAQEWLGDDGGLDPIHVSARSKGGATRVSIQSDFYGIAVVTGILCGFTVLIGTILLAKFTGLPAMAELALSGGIFGGAGIAWRRFLGRMSARRQAAIGETEHLIERLAERPLKQPASTQDQADEIHLQH
jgi:hypothetical protein